jgi:hypothetical protein
VETQLASKLEKVLRCELTPWQLLLYKGIFDNKIVMHNKMVQLRKVCNHPYLFHPYTRSIAGASDFVFDEDAVRCCGKFALLDRILPKLKATGHRVLIFNQMTKVMNILEEYFRLRQYKFLRLDGNTATADRTQGLVDFNAKGSDYFIFILSTKAGGLGLNLQSADTVILFDSDWNPQNDEQVQTPHETHTHTYKYTHIHAYTHTYTHTHTHIHTNMYKPPSGYGARTPHRADQTGHRAASHYNRHRRREDLIDSQQQVGCGGHGHPGRHVPQPVPPLPIASHSIGIASDHVTRHYSTTAVHRSEAASHSTLS